VNRSAISDCRASNKNWAFISVICYKPTEWYVDEWAVGQLSASPLLSLASNIVIFSHQPVIFRALRVNHDFILKSDCSTRTVNARSFAAAVYRRCEESATAVMGWIGRKLTATGRVCRFWLSAPPEAAETMTLDDSFGMHRAYRIYCCYNIENAASICGAALPQAPCLRIKLTFSACYKL
jgi:hypothetical protein